MIILTHFHCRYHRKDRSFVSTLDIYERVVEQISLTHATTHLFSIERVNWPQLHEIFKECDANTRQRQFPEVFLVRVCALYLLFVNILTIYLLVENADVCLKQTCPSLSALWIRSHRAGKLHSWKIVFLQYAAILCQILLASLMSLVPQRWYGIMVTIDVNRSSAAIAFDSLNMDMPILIAIAYQQLLGCIYIHMISKYIFTSLKHNVNMDMHIRYSGLCAIPWLSIDLADIYRCIA